MSDREQQQAHLSELSEARFTQASDLLHRADARFEAAKINFEAAATARDEARLFWEESLKNLQRAAAFRRKGNRLCWAAVAICIAAWAICLPSLIGRIT